MRVALLALLLVSSARAVPSAKPAFCWPRAAPTPVVAAHHSQVVASGGSQHLAAHDVDSLSKLFARALGWVMLAGSLVVYSPILIRVVRTGKAEGLSVTTWLLALVGFLSSLVYPVRHRFPLSTYSEYICLSLQSGLLLFSLTVYGGHLSAAAAAIGIVALIAVWAVFASLIPLHATKMVQVSDGRSGTSRVCARGGCCWLSLH